MKTVVSTESAARDRRRTVAEVKRSLRALTNEVSLLNHHVSSRVELRDVDLDCLDYLAQHGPAGPSALARRAGVHPATMTGILDRLERDGWITRERDTADRRSVVVKVERARTAELFHLYSGMNDAMDALCSTYDAEQLDVISDFLSRAAAAGRNATDEFVSE